MTIKEIEAYLQKENEVFSSSVLQEIEIKRSEAIKAQDEAQANECWRLAMIYYTQKEFVSIWQQLKRKRYEAAWESVRQTDIQLMALEQNFGLGTPEEDPYHLVFIRNTLPEYIKLFPYEYFISREAVIKQERCSICGEPVKLRGGCGHIPGKVYMGEVCVHTITDMEYLNLSAVQDPFDKYDILKPYQTEYNYGMLDGLMQSLRSPYEYWYVEVVREKNPGFAKIGRNDPCPCGSGKKFKHCCMNDPEKMYFDHYKIRMMNELEDHPNQALKIL